MGAILDYGCSGTLTIGSVALNGPAWDIPNLTALWIEYDQRGNDRILPGAAGVIPYRRRMTATRHDLTIFIIGDVDRLGAAYGNATTGLATNVAYLDANVITPTGSGDGTRAATLTRPGLSSLTANVHVLGFRQTSVAIGDTQAIMEGVLQISIPSGRFA